MPILCRISSRSGIKPHRNCYEEPTTHHLFHLGLGSGDGHRRAHGRRTGLGCDPADYYRPLAEDVCQSVLCNLAKAAKQRQLILSVPAWLYRVAQRQTAQTMRSEKRRLGREIEAVTLNTIDRNGQVMSEDIAMALREGLASLSSNEQTILFFRYYDGHSASMLWHCGYLYKATRARCRSSADQGRFAVPFLGCECLPCVGEERSCAVSCLGGLVEWRSWVSPVQVVTGMNT